MRETAPLQSPSKKKKRKHTELVSHISHLWQNEDSSSFEDDDAEEEDGEEKERGNLAAAISFGGESFKVELVLQLEIELDLGAGSVIES